VSARRKLGKLALALALLLALALAGGVGWVAHRRSHEPRLSIPMASHADELRFLEDGAVIAAFDYDRSATFWSSDTGAPLGTIDFAARKVAPISALEDRFVACVDSSIEIHDTRTGGLLKRVPGACGFNRAALSRSGSLVATALAPASEIELRSTTTGEVAGKLELPHAVDDLAAFHFSPRDELLAAWDGDKFELLVWSLADRKLLARMPTWAAIGFLRDGREILSRPKEGAPGDVLAAHSVADGQVLRRYGELPETASAVSASGDRIALLFERSVDVVDAATGALLRRIVRVENPFALAFSPAGDRLAIGYRDPRIEIWDLPP
jgi:WD40 repeat protein